MAMRRVMRQINLDNSFSLSEKLLLNDLAQAGSKTLSFKSYSFFQFTLFQIDKEAFDKAVVIYPIPHILMKIDIAILQP